MKKEYDIDLEIYNKVFLIQGISDFSDVWEISLENNILCISWENESEINEIFNEYINYVSGLINENI